MTTIFADAKKGVMVCDSKCSIGDEWVETPDKVIKHDGELIGVSGLAAEGDRWLEWYQGDRSSKPPKTSNCAIMVLCKEGVHLWQTTNSFWKVPQGFFGVGSGGALARAAFMGGADAKKAVEIACKIDTGSGGAIYVHKLKA